MAIEVELPDGSVVEFPDGTASATMERALQQYAQKADFSGVTASVDTTADKASEPSLLDRAGRELGLGARAMIGGAYGLSGIVADPIIAGVNALGRKAPTMAGLVTGEQPRHIPVQENSAQAADRLSDWLGLPEPETATERVGGDITSALTGGGGLMSLGRGLAKQAPGVIQKVGTMLASQPATQTASIVSGSGAAGVTREAGGGQGAQMAAGLIGGLGVPLAKTGAAMTVRGVARGGEGTIDPQTGRATSGRLAMEQNIRDFNAVGAQPSVGQAAGNRRMQGLESLLSGAPTSGGVMARAAERQADDIGGGLQKLADDFMPRASGERAGRAVEKGAETFANNVRATKQALYWQADRFIPETTQVPLQNTWQKIVDLTSPTPGAVATTGAMVNPKIAQLRQALQQDLAAGQGQIPYSALKRVRSEIGEALGDYSLTTDTPTREYKALYAALSRDMEAAARSRGPEAMAAARRANNYTRAASDRLEQVQRVIDKNGGPEKVYNAVMSGTRDGGTTLRAVMQSLPKDGQRAVTGAVIKRMGLANPGAQDATGEAFSANTFLTNWNKVSPEAKRALFDRHGPKFAENMNKVARVADRIKSGSQVFANPSGTANKGLAYAYYGSLPATALVGGAVPLALQVMGGVAANVGARMLTNPKIVGWLARATEMPASSIPQQVLILKAQAKAENDPEIAEFAELLEAQQPPSQATGSR